MPTLYRGHAQSSVPMVAIKLPAPDYLTYFDRSFRPFRIPAATDEIHSIKHANGNTETLTDKDYKKHYKLFGAIGGEMKPGTKHSDGNTLGRDLMPLDFDSIPDEAKFLQSIHDKLDTHSIGYVLYKTFSYRPDNVRYRLLVPLSRMVTRPNEFKAIMIVLAKMLGTELDPASTRWGQIFFLPTMTENNSENFMRVHQGAPIVVNSWIERTIKDTDLLEAKKQLLQPTGHYTAPKIKTPLGFALDRIVAGQATPSDYLTMTHRLWRCNLSSAEIYPWYEYFNTLQPKPLKFDELAARQYDRGPKKAWGNMFVAMINGTDEHDIQAGTARNGTMFNFAAFLLDQRVKQETLFRLIEDLNDRNRPPLNSNELTSIINSALRRKEDELNGND